MLLPGRCKTFQLQLDPSPNFSDVPVTAETKLSLLNHIRGPSVAKERKTIICRPVVDTFLASWFDMQAGLRRGQSLYAGTVPTTDITVTDRHLKTGSMKCQSFKLTCVGYLRLSEDGTAGFLVRRCGTTLEGCRWFPV